MIPQRMLTPLALAAVLAAGGAQAQETYKLAYIDPLSGPFANVGEMMLLHTRYAVEDINAKGGLPGGMKMQLLQFDSKLSAQEAQSALQAAIALEQGLAGAYADFLQHHAITLQAA